MLGLFLNMVIFLGSLISEVITGQAPLYSLDKECIILLCRGMHNLPPEHPQPYTVAHCLVNKIVYISAPFAWPFVQGTACTSTHSRPVSQLVYLCGAGEQLLGSHILGVCPVSEPHYSALWTFPSLSSPVLLYV